MSHYLTTAELSSRWHCEPATLYDLRTAGKAPCSTKVGRSILWDASSVEALEEDGQCTAWSCTACPRLKSDLIAAKTRVRALETELAELWERSDRQAQALAQAWKQLDDTTE